MSNTTPSHCSTNALCELTAIPQGFRFDDICRSPKAQPTCRVTFRDIHADSAPVRQSRRGSRSSRTATTDGVIEYHILHTGLFVRVATMPGRLYWMAQNADSHRTPDWKLHVSVLPEYIPRVWDEVLLPTFFSFPTIGRVGAKAVLEAERVTYSTSDSIGLPGDFVTTTDSSHWAEEQYGREVTIYLFHDDPTFDTFFAQLGPTTPPTASPTSLWVGDNPDLIYHWKPLAQKMSSYSGKQLIKFVVELQKRLDAMDAASMPQGGSVCRHHIAEGDLGLTRAVSLRNEAYATSGRGTQATKVTTLPVEGAELQYPLNEWGWNAAAHPLPKPIRSCIAYFRGTQDAALHNATDVPVLRPRPKVSVGCC